MKYEGTRKAGTSDEHSLYLFSVGKDELRVLKEAVEYIKKVTPRSSDTHIFHSRITTMMKQLGEVWRIAREEKTKNHWD